MEEECCYEEASRILDNFNKMMYCNKLFNQFKVMEVFCPQPEDTILIPDLLKLILDFGGLVRVSSRSLIFLVYR